MTDETQVGAVDVTTPVVPQSQVVQAIPVPAVKGKRGRPKGSKNSGTPAVPTADAPKAKRGRKPNISGMDGILLSVVQKEVNSRLKAAKAAGIEAFTKALGV